MPEELFERNLKILSLYKSGQTLKEIAEQFNISVQRIQQITSYYGCHRHKGGYQKKKEQIKASYNNRCSVKSCSRPFEANGLCKSHYNSYTRLERLGKVQELDDYLVIQHIKHDLGVKRMPIDQVRQIMKRMSETKEVSHEPTSPIIKSIRTAERREKRFPKTSG